MANTSLPNYTNYWGSKYVWQGLHFGPTSYTTGGETFSAATLGWGGLEFVLADNMGQAAVNSVSMVVPLSTSRTYFVGITFATTATGVVASVTIKWFVVATGAEVANATNLSAESVRLLAVGV